MHRLVVLDTVWWPETSPIQAVAVKVHRFTRLDSEHRPVHTSIKRLNMYLLALVDRLPKTASFSDGSKALCRLLLRQSWYATHTRYIVVVMVVVLLVELVVVMMVLQLSSPTLALRQ